MGNWRNSAGKIAALTGNDVTKKKPHRKNRSKARQAQRRARVRRLAATALKTAGGLIAVPAMAAAFIFAHDLVTQWDHFNVQTIQVAGNRHLDRQQVLDLAGIRPGQNILSVNLGLCRKKLLGHGWIADAAVNRKLPAGLGIEIREHTAAAVLDIGPGFLMDAQGKIFKKRAPGEAARLPVVSGLAFADIAAPDKPQTPAMQAVVELLEMGRTPAAVIPEQRLKKIRVDRETGLTLTLAGRIETVKIGFDRYTEKLRMLGMIRQLAGRSDTFANIETIDLNNTSRIVLGPVAPDRCRVKNKEV